MAFSEDRYFREFKRLRNRFRKYQPVDLVLRAIKYANEGTTKLENAKRHPWLMMLLVKWVLIDDNFFQSKRPVATNRELDQIFQKAYKLADFTRMPNEYEHLQLFLRAVAYQQFLYQREFEIADFARQFVLFGELDDHHKLSRAFRETVGLEIDDFLSLTLALVVKYAEGSFEPVSGRWFSSLKMENLHEITSTYLDAISGTPVQQREFLLSKSGKKRGASEYLEQSPLIARPLLCLGNNYWPLHTALLYRGLEHFVYDHLRSIDPESFMRSFGKIFETYVADVVSGLPSLVLNENDLRQLRIEKGKVVDFLVVEEDANIYIDAKGVSGTHEAMVAHVSQIVRDRTKAAALKALQQSNELMRDIYDGNLGDTSATRNKNNVLIVVTYKDLYLGNGLTFKESVASEDMERICGNRNDGIPLENVYFMSIDAFENLCGAVESGQVSFLDVIRKARRNDSDARTKKFEFLQHLSEMRISRQMPRQVRERLERAFKHLERNLGESDS